MNTTYFMICLVAATAPGPGVLALLHHGMNYGLKRSIPLILGMQSGLAVAGVVAGSGIGLIIFSSPTLSVWFHLAGGGYLFCYGVIIFKSTVKSPVQQRPTRDHASYAGFLQGLLVACANPKTVLFFMAVIPAFLEGSEFIWYQISSLVGLLMVVTLIVHVVYGHAAEVVAHYVTRYLSTLNRVTGLLFISLSLPIIGKAW